MKEMNAEVIDQVDEFSDQVELKKCIRIILKLCEEIM